MTKQLTPEGAAAMTVNERLFSAGLLGAFDQAVQSRNEERLRQILADVFLSSRDADAVIRSVLGPASEE